MVSLETPLCDFGKPAVDFALPGTDGKVWTLADCRGPGGLRVMFICNHCPYIKAVRTRLVRDAREFQTLGVGSVTIMSNDPAVRPENSFENMQRIAREFAFPFPYLLDARQTVAWPVAQSVPRISLVTTAGWMPAARKRWWMHVGNCSRSCGWWRKRGKVPRNRFRVSAVHQVA